MLKSECAGAGKGSSAVWKNSKSTRPLSITAVLFMEINIVSFRPDRPWPLCGALVPGGMAEAVIAFVEVSHDNGKSDRESFEKSREGPKGGAEL
jgi:hypothetical protein